MSRIAISLMVMLSSWPCFLPAAPTHPDSVMVKTTEGVVQGTVINEGRVRAYLGLRYAAPPVGALRWRAPAPARRWAGIRQAASYGAHCAQGQLFEDMVFQDHGGSEDCLFLNIFAPARASGGKLPIMLWIHGGGYSGGAGNEPRHNGDHLPLKGVVLVTINYRLGVFGFLATDELAREGHGAAGNYGLLDMIAALQWVKANAAAFGGDANNLTIFGESAGSLAVATLMASPLAQGLFAKGIGQSGAPFPGAAGLGVGSQSELSRTSQAWMVSVGVKSVEELRTMSTEQVLAAAKKVGVMGFSPVTDGHVLVEPIADTYVAGRQAHVPLMAGWNADEGNFFVANGLTRAAWSSQAERLFGQRAAEFLRLYPADTDAAALRSAIDYGGDAFIAFGTWQWLETHRKTGRSPVYRYHFELAAPPSKFHAGTFAFHSDDIEYVFGTLDTRPGFTVRDEDRRLSELMMDYWTNFAKTGNPNAPGLPAWPVYGADDPVMHLADPVISGPDALRSRYEFLLGGIPPMKF